MHFCSLYEGASQPGRGREAGLDKASSLGKRDQIYEMPCRVLCRGAEQKNRKPVQTWFEQLPISAITQNSVWWVLLQKHEEGHKGWGFTVLLLCLDGHSEQFRDEHRLSGAVSFVDSSHLSFPDHMHDLIALQCSLCRLKRK